MTNPITKLVHLSCRHPWAVVGVFALLVLASALYVTRHFAINTDVGQLIDASAPWARRDAAIAAAFPNRGDTTLAVVRAPQETQRFAPGAFLNPQLGQMTFFSAIRTDGAYRRRGSRGNSFEIP